MHLLVIASNDFNWEYLRWAVKWIENSYTNIWEEEDEFCAHDEDDFENVEFGDCRVGEKWEKLRGKTRNFNNFRQFLNNF